MDYYLDGSYNCLEKLVGELKPHKMDDKDFQKKSIESIFRTASFAPLFKPNPKYCLDQFAELTPYISYSDIKNNRIFIRGCPIGVRNSQDSGKREVIIAYTTIEELVEDGWRLTDKLETIKISQTQF